MLSPPTFPLVLCKVDSNSLYKFLNIILTFLDFFEFFCGLFSVADLKILLVLDFWLVQGLRLLPVAF
jgi:hypothetical protein